MVVRNSVVRVVSFIVISLCGSKGTKNAGIGE